MTLIKDVAALLVAARRSGRIASLPAELEPTTIESAFAIQTETVRQLGSVSGWKVAPTKDGSAPLVSPILADAIHASPAELAEIDVPAPEIEVEIAVRFGQDLPQRDTPYSRAEVEGAIASLHPALEILSSRFLDRKSVPGMIALADCQSNGAAVIGPALADWRSVDFSKVAMTLRFDGAEVGSTEGGVAAEHVLESLTWLANHAPTRGLALRAGDVVITGARVGPVPAAAPVQIDADVAGIGSVSLKLI